MILGIQILGLLFGAFVLYMTFLNYKRREFTINEFGFWSAVAVALSIIAVFPDVLNPVVQTLNLSRTLDFLIIVGFIFLITAAFYTYLVTRRTQRMMEEVVRNLALERPQKVPKRRK